ncbi:RNA polymerase sigma factor SigY [Sporosalibacterium faouarense]|uniref:RNA polymerase sigma factor SigY n=1 Tax=Sporosalibacterium faouarense TaxID=516123 RepID=UPI00141C6CD5|nr:RNA polymerase sigma factor SigY [Sporosalibacterium faouarense]MTI47496.1 RNA polymerase sigma factor SigY [Bacillota bacterium]
MEDKLIRLAQKGDKKAMEKLLQRNYPILKGYLLKITRNEALSDDLTQEVMVRAIMKIHKYKPRGKFSTWLITIGTNLFRDKIRKDKRLVFDDSITKDESTNSLEDQVMIKESIRDINSIIQKFPEEKRMVFILKHYYGYRYDEIAGIMDCPIGTVRSRLHYCIKEIKNHVKDVDDDG